MIQAGLPEGAILNKIHADRQRLDRSAQALILLKKNGATDAELTALSAEEAPQTTATTNVSTVPISVFGAALLRTPAGDPYLQFPSLKSVIFPDGTPSNTVALVLYDGQPAFRIPVTEYAHGQEGELLILKHALLVSSYVSGGVFLSSGKAETPREIAEQYKYELRPAEIFPLPKYHIEWKTDRAEDEKVLFGVITTGEKHTGTLSLRVGVYPFRESTSWVVKTTPKDALLRSVELRLFVDAALGNFDDTLARFEQAAAISDLGAALSSAAHYQLKTEAESQRIKLILQQRLDERQTHGSDWLLALGTMNQMASAARASRAAGGAIQGAVTGDAGKQQASLAVLRQALPAAADQVTPSSVVTPVSDNATIEAAKAEQLAKINARARANALSSTLQRDSGIVATASVNPPVAAGTSFASIRELPPQDGTQDALTQLTLLQQQMAATSDPCPFMPKLKAAINQLARQSPDVYNAMKPTLDLLNQQDDGCTPQAAPAPAADTVPETVPVVVPQAEKMQPLSSDRCRTGTEPPSPGSTLRATTACVTSSTKPGGLKSAPPPAAAVAPLAAGPARPAASSKGPAAGPSGKPAQTNTGSPAACATTPSGSQLALVPGTTAGSCNPASCRDMLYSVRLVSRWTSPEKVEIEASLLNNSIGEATCTWAYHKHGVWSDYRGAVLKPGQTLKGIGTTGADSSTIRHVCYEGVDPVDVHGRLCNENIHFDGMTDAGTDR